MYMIRNNKTNLFYVGGINGVFRKNGKVYAELSHLKLALQGVLEQEARNKLYKESRQAGISWSHPGYTVLRNKIKAKFTSDPHSFIPDDWELVCLEPTGWKILPISTLFPIFKGKPHSYM